MNKEQLYQALDDVNHSRKKRKEMAQLVSDHPHLALPLLQIAIEDKDYKASKASWIIEFTAKENLQYIFPYLDLFTSSIGSLKRDSSVRPMAKVCEYLITAYFRKTKNEVQNQLNEEHLEKITNACFDWLIGDHKVAAQAYSMTCLLLLGKKFDWIHPELKMVLKQNYIAGSAAYKARARITLAKIK